jgi:hypothetical protein
MSSGGSHPQPVTISQPIGPGRTPPIKLFVGGYISQCLRHRVGKQQIGPIVCLCVDPDSLSARLGQQACAKQQPQEDVNRRTLPFQRWKLPRTVVARHVYQSHRETGCLNGDGPMIAVDGNVMKKPMWRRHRIHPVIVPEDPCHSPGIALFGDQIRRQLGKALNGEVIRKIMAGHNPDVGWADPRQPSSFAQPIEPSVEGAAW